MFVPTLTTADFFGVIRASTFLLDTFPFGGGVSSLEAFSACKAVLTLPSHQSVSRLTGGMVKRMKLEKFLLATDIGDLIVKAKELLVDNHRANIESQICEKNKHLFQQNDVIDEWEAFLQRVHFQSMQE